MPEQFSLVLWEAIHRGDHAAVLRHARKAAGWSQTELGDRFGCSASAISRFESGRRLLHDVTVLRRMAVTLGLPAEAFGLTPARPDRVASQRAAAGASKVSQVPQREEVDSMRRRTFLFAAGVASTSLATSPFSAQAAGYGPDPAAMLTHRLDSVLISTTLLDAPPASVASLRTTLTAARADFKSARYLSLAARLPELVTTAEVTAADDATADLVLAQAYNLVTRVLIKLRASGLEWVSADRAIRAATRADDPLTLAEAQRLMGSVCRRAGHHHRAQALTLHADDQLNLSNDRPASGHLALHGVLMCSAGYAAARAGDRDRADALLDEAKSTVVRLAGYADEQRSLTANVISHRVSAAYILGDAGSALQHARRAHLADFPDSERQGRFLVDVALAFAQGNKPEKAYRALLDAERLAPGEVQTRSAVRGLVTGLMQQKQAALPGLHDLAIRTHTLT